MSNAERTVFEGYPHISALDSAGEETQIEVAAEPHRKLKTKNPLCKCKGCKKVKRLRRKRKRFENRIAGLIKEFRQAEEARRAEEEHRAEEARKADEARRAEELRKAEEARNDKKWFWDKAVKVITTIATFATAVFSFFSRKRRSRATA
jgi:hypothetical protein